MHRLLSSALVLSLCLAAAAPALATPWHDFGPRAMGMGGAGVAVAQGPDAVFYNPAALSHLENASGFAVNVGARGEFTGTVLQGANDLNKLNDSCSKLDAANCTTAKINEAFDHLGQAGNGAQVDVAGAMTFKFKRLAFFALNETYLGASPELDRTIGVLGSELNNNQSKLVLRGGMFNEFGVGYGREIGETGLVLGGNLKLISGKVGYHELRVVAEDSDSIDKFKDDAKTSLQPAVDLGVLWNVKKTFENALWQPKLGLVGRNLNNPTFKQPDAAKVSGERDRFSLHGQLRAGASVSPFNFWHLAADVDLTENVSYIDGYKSRYMGLGTEVNVFNRSWINIPLRAGLKKNLSDTASGLAYTAGFGLNLAHVMIDVGGQVSSKTTTLQSERESKKIPNNFAAGVRVAVLFGGGEKAKPLAAEEVAPSTKPE